MIDEAVQAGARQHKACEVVGISPRTLQNWRKRPGEGDLRRGPKRPPTHKITAQEREDVLAELNDPKHVDLSPKQLVAKLADEGRYLVSESSMYRILREEKMLRHRLPSAPPQERNKGAAVYKVKVYKMNMRYTACIESQQLNISSHLHAESQKSN